LPAVCTSYATPPLLPFFHPPIKLASLRPGSRLDLDRRINLSTIFVSTLPHVIIAEIDI